MREILPEPRKPAYIKYWPIFSVVASVAIAGLLFAVFSGSNDSLQVQVKADDPVQVQVKAADPKFEPFDPTGMSMADLLSRAESGNLNAQGFVAECYREGSNGFPKDDALRFKWASKAAERGHAWSKVECGICYFHGIGTAQDQFCALAMFIGPARDNNDPIAQIYMGLLNNGENGFPKRDDVAAEWFRKSAVQGNAVGAAAYGRYLLNGSGVPKDMGAAIKYLKLGTDGGVASAMSALGWAYQFGEGVEKDMKEAVRLYRQAAEKGDAYGCNQLGLLHKNGDGVIKDAEQAMKWLKIASDSGYVDAKKNLGSLYQSGEGVPQDLIQASKLFLEVASLGDVECQRITGLRYQLGVGLPIDLIESYAWYNIGASAGDEQSAKSREAVAASFSAEQLVVAQKRSRGLLKDIEAKKAKK